MRLRANIGLLAILACPLAAVKAQVSPALYDYVRSDLDWYTIETEHFLVHFHADPAGQGSSRSAAVTARIAEEIYGPITSLYGHEPDTKVSVILKDFEDYSNGAAYFFDNMIEIWAPALNTPLRGAHAWLRNVISHEFTHIVQVQASMKSGRRVPFVYLQYLDYEDVRRPDVLYGYPNVIASYPIPVLNNPAWLAEGTAQFQRADMDYDTWDSHRDMILRTRVLEGTAFSLKQMGGFYSHTSLGRETVYNQGYALSQYIASEYGEEALAGVSRSLGKWRNWNFERATREPLGKDGEAVFADFMTALEEDYTVAMAARLGSLQEGETIQDDGFYNMHARWSPDGTRIAYLSNQGQDFSRQYLYVIEAQSGRQVLSIELPEQTGYVCSLGHRLTGPASGAISWHPSGASVTYSRSVDTPDGHLYSDLYLLDVASQKSRRMTHGSRLADPSWSPDGSRMAAVLQEDGSTNLVLLDSTGTLLHALTQHVNGEQVIEPVWSPKGDWIYFSRSRRHGYDILRVSPDGARLEEVVVTDHDERSPSLTAEGELVFASDRDGIFNLYARDASGGEERITNVRGGAFMPDVTASGTVVFSRYDWDGYHLATIDQDIRAGVSAPYESPKVLLKGRERTLSGLSDYDDSDLVAIGPEMLQTVQDSGRVALAGVPFAAGSDRAAQVEPYSNTFTSFSFLPVLRLDRYVSRRRSRADVRIKDRSRGETLLRNTKVGLYTGSREILNGLTMFGGLLVSPASRQAESVSDYFSPLNLLKLERDLFVQFELRRGLGLFKGRWAPQWSLELFNVRRNVENGLSIEEFPCTACYPDTTLADLAYNLWEVDLAARSKVNRSLLLEAGVRYSPYKVTTERFFSKELAQAIPESSSRYFIGKAVRLKAYFEALEPHRHMDVIPSGIKVEASVEREWGRLLTQFDVRDGVLTPIYQKDAITRLTLDGRFGMRLFKDRVPHGVSARVRGSLSLGGVVDDFYDDYVGGLTGARGYPFYALGGNRTAWTQVAYTFPIIPSIGKQLGFLYADKLFGRVYGDAVAAWTGAWPGSGGIRKDIGGELRLGLGSFYLLPTAVFVSGTYGLDSFDFQLDEGFLTPDGQSFVTYGKGMQWHVGVLFGFDLF